MTIIIETIFLIIMQVSVMTSMTMSNQIDNASGDGDDNED